MNSDAAAFGAFQKRLEQVAATAVCVLLCGESGSGKGRAARQVHAASPRRAGPLVEVSLSALAPSLIESELFGHVQGAFTGAQGARPGRFRQAQGGTLVLDDIDTLPVEVQVKLLRVLQERIVEPVGAEQGESVDVRIVATTQRDLAEEVAAGRFRSDLYYRLAVVVLQVPPLRSRKSELPKLCNALVDELAQGRHLPRLDLTAAALERLAAHGWPGNVRELENALERALALRLGGSRASSDLDAEDFAFLDESTGGAAEELARSALARGLKLADLEQAMLRVALEEQRGNLSAAARQIGLSRRAAEYRLARGASGPDDAAAAGGAA
jgi:DNA-binding NtrC family response regulator